MVNYHLVWFLETIKLKTDLQWGFQSNQWYIDHRLFADSLGVQGSIPDRVTPKIREIVLDAFLLNTQYYKVGIKGKVEQYRERSSALLSTSVL